MLEEFMRMLPWQAACLFLSMIELDDGDSGNWPDSGGCVKPEKREQESAGEELKSNRGADGRVYESESVSDSHVGSDE
jgi:hypothetical protein